MSSIQYQVGDATTPKAPGNKIICHICNDVGGWGKGFVLALFRKWIAPEVKYRDWFKNRSVSGFSLGALQLVKVESDIWVANLIGQHGIRPENDVPPIRYDAVEDGLRTLAEEARKLDASIHMPRIGCGLAGGTWEKIEPIIERTLCSSGIQVFIYDLKWLR